MKICRTCGVAKSAGEFAAHGNSADGLVHDCDTCRATPRAQREHRTHAHDRHGKERWQREQAFCRAMERKERDTVYPAGQRIYALVDPRDRLVRYVGKTYQPAKRLAKHRRGSGESHSRDAWVDELRSVGLEPEMRILEVVADDEFVLERELRWIFTYLRAGAPLLNVQARSPGARLATTLSLYVDFLTEPRDSPVLGVMEGWDMAKTAGDAWRKGRIWSSQMTLPDAIAWCLEQCPSELPDEFVDTARHLGYDV